MKRLIENLTGTNGNYCYPFFWQHGESHENLKNVLDQMREQGIMNFCVESRPPPDFLGNGWWATLDFLIAEAKKYEMKMWILDDAKFPTGYANGKVPQQYRKRYLDYRRYDIAGKGRVELDVSIFADIRAFAKDKRHQNDRFLMAVLAENDLREKQAFWEDSLQDVSDHYSEGKLTLQLEGGHYSVFVLYETDCGEEKTKDYLDPMQKEATQILINEVYEKHYQRYAEDFGKTLVGFFSDEPRFGNTKGTEALIGRSAMPLPWNAEVIRRLRETGNFTEAKLVLLFLGNGEEASCLRQAYMDIVTDLYSKNFSQTIGDWCRAHDVDYAGHTIEDNNAHSRLGYGAGHYFRGIAGQTIAGIDIIGGQIVPGMDYEHGSFSSGGSDGEFYHYALVKLGASSAKLDPAKKGVLMCEAFGAYGWIEGLKMMKWITDHMLSHGVNLIVPHAFNPAPFPDRDCPPHFYAQGKNPQYPYFHRWTAYANRLCHLLSGGYHQAEVGVLYNAFAEWSGEAMPMQKVLKVLQQNQIECDVISEDFLMNGQIESKGLTINGYRYSVIVVPAAQRLPKPLLDKLGEIAEQITVIFVDQRPGYAELKRGQTKTLALLPVTLEKFKTLKTSRSEPSLTVYRYKLPDGEVIMLNNENIIETIDTEVEISAESLLLYDAYENKTARLESTKTETGIRFHLRLDPYQSIVLVSGKETHKRPEKGMLLAEIDEAQLSWKAYDQAEYSKPQAVKIDNHLADAMPYFSGSLKYELDLPYNPKVAFLELKEAFEVIELIVNGKCEDVRIAPPFCFDLTEILQPGNNHIEIIATNNLARKMRDPMSSYLALEPLGLTQSIRLYQRRHEVKQAA